MLSRSNVSIFHKLNIKMNLNMSVLMIASSCAIVIAAIYYNHVSSTKYSKLQKDSYDFIVVGIGTAGSVVASRLSEKYDVLALDIGGMPGDVLDIPATCLGSAMNPEFANVYLSVPQKHVSLHSNGVIKWIQGQTFGGGSSVNGMIHNRGSSHDFDNWANVTGDNSWSYAKLLEYFKKNEDYQGNYESEKHHGKGGHITISTSKYAPGLDELLEAGKFLGYPTDVDPNGGQTIGFTSTEYSRKHGRRVSAFKGYLEPYLQSRSQLTVLPYSQALKITFNGTKAIGVVVNNTKTGEIFEVFAKKEIILSAGTMDSAATLMRSGVGPKDVLEAASISPVKYLPVGHNLQDHVVLKMDYTVAKDVANIFIPERDLTPENLKLYEETGDGPYSSMLGIHGQAFLRSSRRSATEPSNWADVHILHSQAHGRINIIPDVMRNNSEIEKLVISQVLVLGRPKSSGRVYLDPEDINGRPLIDFQFLSHPDDEEIFLEIIKMSLKIMEETPSFQKYGAQFNTKPLSACSHITFRSDEYWRCLIRQLASSGLHAGGTCRMGRVDDPYAVVDSNLRVIGIQGLRVADLSIMPNVTNANTQAPAYVIGEKAAALILESY